MCSRTIVERTFMDIGTSHKPGGKMVPSNGCVRGELRAVGRAICRGKRRWGGRQEAKKLRVR
jgi:hypothetical protein